MKILTFHLYGHDANVTYYDGTTVKYLNLERLKKIKKYAYNEKNLRHVRKDLACMNIDHDNLDIIAFSVLEKKNDTLDWQFGDDPVREVSQEVFDDAFPFISMYAKKYYRIQHHWCHRRVGDWLFGPTQKALVIDGQGDYNEHLSVFDDRSKIVDYKANEMLSVGRLYALSSLQMIKSGKTEEGGTDDQVGKLMGLMSYGEHNESYANWLRQFSFKEVTAQMYNRVIFEQHQYFRKTEIVDQCTQHSVGLAPDFDAVDWLHTWQNVLFEYMLEFCKEHFDKNEVFSFSGGVAHNVCFNELLSKEFPHVRIPPCVGDEGLSLGMMYELLPDKSVPFPTGQYSTETVEDISTETIEAIAYHISMGRIVANYQGEAEIGPRALGRRSLFCRPDLFNAPQMFNEKQIKNREWWRPYGIIILEEELENYLDTTTKSPYMLHTAQVKNKEALSGVVHADNSVRYQTVNENDGWLYELLKIVQVKTGIPAVVNTSLNQQGYPIMYSEADFYDYMQTVPGDVFVIGNDVWGNNV